ncbi:MAG TPA: hypothetical protein VG324_12340 [Blastocatellia bacterium]|nr:hypothetical protein [Blastocatellia bacterium]
MARPYLYHYAGAFSRSQKLSQAIARKELDKAGFEIASKPAAWEHFAFNADTIVVVTNVPLSRARPMCMCLRPPTRTPPPKSGLPQS